MKKIAIGLPAYSSYDPRVTFNLMDLSAALGAHKVEFSRFMITQNPDIAHCHNMILEQFINSEAERLLIIDSDVTFDFRDAIKLLMNTQEDIVAGNYRVKSSIIGYSSKIKQDGLIKDNLREAIFLATGFISISKLAALKIAENSTTYIDKTGCRIHQFTSTGVTDDKWVSSDKWLSQAWQKLGGKVWIDTSIKLGHVGSLEYI